MSPGYSERYYRSHDGLELYYRDYAPQGARPLLPVLCLPGLTRNSRDFAVLADWLRERGRRVLVADLRGRGRSQHDPNWHNYHPGSYLVDVQALLEHAGAPRALFIGTSLGGLLSMLTALTHPATIAGAVINDIGPELEPEGLERIRGYVGRGRPLGSWEDAVLAARAINAHAFPDLDDAQWLAFARRLFREQDGGLVADYDPMIGEAARMAPVAPVDLWPAFRALGPLPALALRGAHSDILSATTLQRMQREKPDLRVVTIANRGHAPLLDEPDALAALHSYFESVP
jgi:pimeloyl-ACP methyl ester carboxylesterase